jgi:uncharacterized RDD family membrane protein YckC
LSCPGCGAPAPPAGSRCSACGAAPPPITEGALAPDPARAEPLREIPGLRKRERTWKDEVRDRVRERRRFRGAPGELPLFKGIDDEDEPEVRDAAGELPAAPVRDDPSDHGIRALEDDDLPLRPRDELRPAITFETPRPSATAMPRDVGRRAIVEAPPSPSWDLGPSPRADAPPRAVERPVERPAVGFERLYAAALDLAVLALIWAAVIYFASRSARVAIPALQPAWPWLVGYLAFIGLVYAGYFTGTTGQTLGKMAAGLRVVDAGGQPPGYLRAFTRALIGAFGVLAAGSGLLPMLFDPARRALHDRLFRTRVIKG